MVWRELEPTQSTDLEPGWAPTSLREGWCWDQGRDTEALLPSSGVLEGLTEGRVVVAS